MNKSTKGRRYEAECREIYEREGWKCLFKSQRIKFGRIDFANLFDLVMAKEKTRLYISVKSRSKPENFKKHIEEISDFKKQFGLENERFLLAVHYSGHWKGRGKKRTFNQAYWQSNYIE